jgi:hypothetical protein
VAIVTRVIMSAPTVTEHRQRFDERPQLSGVPVREDDIEPVKGLRTIAVLFRGMAILLLALMVMQVALGLTSTVAISYGVMVADAVRLVIFAGLLWGFGDLAVLWVKSHHDLRATKILMARTAHIVQQIGEATGHLPPAGGGESRAGRET